MSGGQEGPVAMARCALNQLQWDRPLRRGPWNLQFCSGTCGRGSYCMGQRHPQICFLRGLNIEGSFLRKSGLPCPVPPTVGRTVWDFIQFNINSIKQWVWILLLLPSSSWEVLGLSLSLQTHGNLEDRKGASGIAGGLQVLHCWPTPFPLHGLLILPISVTASAVPLLPKLPVPQNWQDTQSLSAINAWELRIIRI